MFGIISGCNSTKTSLNGSATSYRPVAGSWAPNMDVYGGYSGYSEWKVTVTPCLQYGIDIEFELVSDDSEGIIAECDWEDQRDNDNPVCAACVEGSDSPDGCPLFGKLAEGDDWKDYFHQTFDLALNTELEYSRGKK